MRHALLLIEVSRQVRILRQQNCRRVAGKILAIANQVSLIIISAGHRSLHPIARWLSKHMEDIVEALYAAKKFGRETHGGQEAALRLRNQEIAPVNFIFSG